MASIRISHTNGVVSERLKEHAGWYFQVNVWARGVPLHCQAICIWSEAAGFQGRGFGPDRMSLAVVAGSCKAGSQTNVGGEVVVVVAWRQL